MIKFLSIFLLLVGMAMTGCGITRAVYGVPEEQWARMNEQERQATIERFKRQQEINAQTREQAEKAREEAEEFASQCHDEHNLPVPEKCKVISRHRVWFPKAAKK